MSRQSSSNLLLVRPKAPGFNPETGLSNAFQRELDTAPGKLALQVAQEYDEFVAVLQNAGINIIQLPDHSQSPDATFPNNWFSTHEDGTVYIYPMQSPARRTEKQVEHLRNHLVDAGFRVSRIRDWSTYESEGLFLEGTGVLIIDRMKGRVYGSLSERCHPALFKEWAAQMKLEPISFSSADENGQAVYHSNVIMSLGSNYALICLDYVQQEADRLKLHELLSEDRVLINISAEQVNQFSGNCLEAHSDQGSFLIMSEQARGALNKTQLGQIAEAGLEILSSPLDHVEAIGGGSARCMLAEVFLPLSYPS
jgi:hypothetical protein